MRSREFITERSMRHPVICVDVQAAYGHYPEIIEFVNNQQGPVLMFVNADGTGMTDESISEIQQYWNETLCGYYDHVEEGDIGFNVDEEAGAEYDEETGDYVEKECDGVDWNRVEIVDKGYGYMRAWMDSGVPENLIVKVIREMYQQKVNDTRMLFDGDDSQDYREQMNEFLGTDEYESLYDDNMSVEWTSVAQLKRFSGAYIVGGGRTECLREVELLMNAFNIKYKRIDQLVYG